MNKRQIEVQKIHVAEEKEILRQLKKVYEQAARDCEVKIRELSMRTDLENLQSVIWQQQYQEALKKQLDSVLDSMNAKSFTSIADYLTVCYENGFFGTLYDLQGQGIPLILPINQEEAVLAIQVDSQISHGLYGRMGENVDDLKKSIRSELSRGISNGSSWNRIAVSIAAGMNSPFSKAYNRAALIARTEGHRVQQEAALHCQQKAKGKGADVVKQWDSTLDGLTRPHHRELDGQVREVEEPFEVAGKRAMYPGGFGDPSEDCNCRCCLLQRARRALSEQEYYTKWDGDKNELVEIKAKDYNEFKEKAYKINRDKKEEIQVHLVGKINKDIYKCITDDIVTDEVVITDNQIQHIKDRHPSDYERFSQYFGQIVAEPDYIIKANKPDTAVILKEILDGDERFQTVLRLCTSKEPEGYKNSIITFLKIDEKRWNRYLRTKEILYKKE